MRYPASEKLEIIRTVETSHLPVRKTLDKIGIPKTTFYAWLDRYASGGFDALEDRKPRPKRVWNRIAEEEIKRRTLEQRRRQHFKRSSMSFNQMGPKTLLDQLLNCPENPDDALKADVDHLSALGQKLTCCRCASQVC